MSLQMFTVTKSHRGVPRISTTNIIYLAVPARAAGEMHAGSGFSVGSAAVCSGSSVP